MKSRWFVRSLVALTATFCLGVGGYAGQVWWAKRVAFQVRTEGFPQGNAEDTSGWLGVWGTFIGYLATWERCPWYGFCEGGRWIPRRTFYEFFRAATGQDLPDDPAAWRSWLNGAQSGLAWDDKQKRFVELKPEARP